jgi:3-phosphoshikimate 1-carboxyvinyltransferase
MICTCIQHKEFKEIAELLDGLEMAEIRLDRCALDDEQISLLFSGSDVPLVATCRLREESSAPEILERAIVAGAKYVDLEMEAPAAVGRRIREACRQYGTVLIRSWHDDNGTPDLPVLRAILERARSFGGEVVKIVTKATCKADADRVLQLYEDAEPGTLIAFAMGEAGRQSRLEALRRGAPFTYACIREEEATAPGQWPTHQMRQAVYGNFRFVKADQIQAPCSKSMAQRAVIAAALADGTSHLEGFTPCEDTLSALRLAQAMGAKVVEDGSRLTITGIGAAPGCLDVESLHAGESGFLARLIIPLLSVLSPHHVRVTGEKTLLRRPLAAAHDILAAYGIRLYPEIAPANDRKSDCYLPLKVAGPLIPGRADVSGKGGSQLLSGLLAALPLAGGKSDLYISEPRSIPYLFMTVDVLKAFGVRISSEMEGDEAFIENQDWSHCTGVHFRIRGEQRYRAADFQLEGDWSGAAAFLVAAAIFGEVEVTGLDTRSLQADLSILDILMEAGASLSQLDGPDGPVHVVRAPLNAFRADLNQCPDLFPLVAVLAAFCPGETHLLGVERLRHKETDRAAALVETLTQMGVNVVVNDDEMVVNGISLSQRITTGCLLQGGRYSSFGDHRMVMALRVAALGADAPIEIDDTACVSKSFPTFHELFDRL